jgi:hypothetical protein
MGQGTARGLRMHNPPEVIPLTPYELNTVPEYLGPRFTAPEPDGTWDGHPVAPDTRAARLPIAEHMVALCGCVSRSNGAGLHFRKKITW